MSSKNVLYSACFHEFFNVQNQGEKKVELSQCNECGILKIEEDILMKPFEYNFKCEFDQIVLFNEILENSWERETSQLNSTYSNKRIVLIDFLKKLTEKYRYTEETYHMSVEYLDYILSKQSATKYDLTVISCFILAAKFFENDAAIPEYSCYMNSNREYYTSKQIAQAEVGCVQMLQYKLNLYPPFSIVKYFLNNGLVSSEDQETVREFYTLSNDILRIFVRDSRSLHFTGLQTALASVLLASNYFEGLSSKVADTLNRVYDCKVEYFVNAYLFIKSTYKNSLCSFKQKPREGKKSSECKLWKTPQTEIVFTNNKKLSYDLMGLTTSYINNPLSKSLSSNAESKSRNFRPYNIESVEEINKNFLNCKFSSNFRIISPTESYMSTNPSQGSQKKSIESINVDSFYIDMTDRDNSQKEEKLN